MDDKALKVKTVLRKKCRNKNLRRRRILGEKAEQKEGENVSVKSLVFKRMYDRGEEITRSEKKFTEGNISYKASKF